MGAWVVVPECTHLATNTVEPRLNLSGRPILRGPSRGFHPRLEIRHQKQTHLHGAVSSALRRASRRRGCCNRHDSAVTRPVAA
jgi:hypothetical protein